MSRTTLYVCYTEMLPGEGCFRCLPDEVTAAEAEAKARQCRLTISHLDVFSPQPATPAIEIIAISPQELGAERAVEISRNAVDWLLKEGYLTK